MGVLSHLHFGRTLNDFAVVAVAELSRHGDFGPIIVGLVGLAVPDTRVLKMVKQQLDALDLETVFHIKITERTMRYVLRVLRIGPPELAAQDASNGEAVLGRGDIRQVFRLAMAVIV